MRQFVAALTAVMVFAVLPGTASAAYSAGLWHFASGPGQVHSQTHVQGPVQSSAAPAQVLLELLNAERSTHGLSPLVMDATLTSLASEKSEDMNNNRYFGHTSTTYGTPAQMLQQASVPYTTFGENIAQGSNAQQIHAMWLNSPGHRANMLNPNFTNVGIGVAIGNSGLTATELFIAK